MVHVARLHFLIMLDGLELRRITYEATPASIIEIIARKESVHPIRDLQDLRTRLSGPTRRCFAFFHPSLPNEPLVFVHVALLPRMPESMEELESLTSSSGSRSNDVIQAAIFYSINNTQKGLSGVDLGAFLIKRVVEVLKQEFSTLRTFATLSPLPNFRMWFKHKVSLQCQLHEHDGECTISSNMTDGDSSMGLKKFALDMLSPLELASLSRALGTSATRETLECFIRTLETSSWYEDPVRVDAFRPILMKYAAIYLAVEKHRGRPLDGVAKFHIRNGAEMNRLNFLADKSRMVRVIHDYT